MNAVLDHFLTHIQALLGSQFVGMYLYGSLALGDFTPLTSDIDFVVVTDADLEDALFERLQEMHAQFAQSGSPWAVRVEALYIAQEALRPFMPPALPYPQIERETALTKMPLEMGWAFQRYVLREHGVIVAGPEPQTLIDPIATDDLRRAATTATQAIVGEWREQAAHDPEWLVWVQERSAQSFLVLTLCRLLYSLDMGDVASKPAAAQWARQRVDEQWAALIARALPGQQEHGEISASELEATIAFIHYTLDRLSS